MIRKLLCVLAFGLMGGALHGQSADEIVSKYIAARGGIEKIRAVKSERVTGTVSLGPEAEGKLVVERKRPMKMYTEVTIAGQSLVRVYDGKSAGWTYNPFMPSPSVQPMSAAEVSNITDEADFDGPFVDYKAKGNKLDFVDKEEVLGKTGYKIRLTSKNGDVSYFYFDAATNLLLKWEGDRKVGDQKVSWESFFHDFREVNGLKYPFLIESDAPGTDQRQKIVADNIEVNIPIPDSRFEKPNPPAAPAAPAPGDAPSQQPPSQN